MYCDKEHIAHNEVLAQIMDVLYHLVNYGYYDSTADMEAIVTPLIAMLAGIIHILYWFMKWCQKCWSLGQQELKEFKEHGTLQDTQGNRALFAVTEKYGCAAEVYQYLPSLFCHIILLVNRALQVLNKLLAFNLYVTLQVCPSYTTEIDIMFIVW